MRSTLNCVMVIIMLILIGVFFYIKPDIGQLGQVTLGCNIYDSSFKLVRKYAGNECFYFKDGSYAVFFRDEKQLKFFTRENLYSSSVNNVLDVFSKDQDENVLAVGLDFGVEQGLENVKFDRILKISKNGQVLADQSLREKSYKLNDKFSKEKQFKPFLLNPDREAPFNYEMTHVSSIYQNEMDIVIKDAVVAPKGSYSIWSNVGIRGLIILDSNLEQVLYFNPLETTNINDVQFVEPNVLIYFKNSTRLINKSYSLREKKGKGYWARFVEFNIEERKRTFPFNENLFGEVGGSVQKITNGLYLIMDFKEDENILEKASVNVLVSDRRLMIYSQYFGTMKQSLIQSEGTRARFENLDSFLMSNKQK